MELPNNMSRGNIYLLRVYPNHPVPLYKLGRTKNFKKRLQQYVSSKCEPEVLLVKKCYDDKKAEKELKHIFKNTFTPRRDTGLEYFGGDVDEMIDKINNYFETVHEPMYGECSETESEDTSEDETIKIIVKTYEEYMKHTSIYKIIITNKAQEEGYIKFRNQEWREIGKNKEETLEDFIENNVRRFHVQIIEPILENNLMDIHMMYEKYLIYTKLNTQETINHWQYRQLSDEDKQKYYKILTCKYKHVEIEYEFEKIMKDIVRKCYTDKPVYYELKYHEHVLSSSGDDSNKIGLQILNCIENKFYDFDEYIDCGIITNAYRRDYTSHNKLIYENTDIKIVDKILNMLVKDKSKSKILEYKKFLNKIFVNPSNETTIFYDYYSKDALFTTWLCDAYYKITNETSLRSKYYYDNRKECDKKIKKNIPRFVVIEHPHYKNQTSEKIIKHFETLGVKNIIIKICDSQQNIYKDTDAFAEFLDNKKEIYIKYISDKYKNKIKISCPDDIFYMSNLLFSNFLLWACSVIDDI